MSGYKGIVGEFRNETDPVTNITYLGIKNP
jgi:hypothetical protein